VCTPECSAIKIDFALMSEITNRWITEKLLWRCLYAKMTELSAEIGNWFVAITKAYGGLKEIRDLLEIEMRVGTLDLRHGHRQKIGKWDEAMHKLDVAVSHPISNVAFHSGLCILTREKVDRLLAECMLAVDNQAENQKRQEDLKINQIQSEKTVCYETLWESSNEPVAFLREARQDRPPKSRLVQHSDRSRVDTKYSMTGGGLDIKLASFGMLGDLRLTAQVESTHQITEAEAAELVLVNKSQSLHQRVRKRLIFDTKLGSGQGHWLIHRTQIETVAGRFVEHELEFELSSHSLTALWVAWDTGDASSIIQNIEAQLVSLVSSCLVSTPEPVRPILQPFDNVHHDLTLRAQLSERLGELTGNPHKRFVGPNPVAFEASQIPRVRSVSGGKPRYLVSEKSNGHRAIFALLRQQGATNCISCIITRDGHWHVREDMPTGDSELVLDGELVFDDKLRRMTYVAFDVFAIEGQCLTQHTFETRQKVLSSLNDRFGQPKSPEELPVFIKEWVTPKSVYRVLESKMVMLRGVRTYTGLGMCHGSDGYICQATQTPFVSGTDLTMFKYKMPDDLTLDLFMNVDLLRKGHYTSPNLVYYHQENANFTPLGGKRPRDVRTPRNMPCRIGSHESQFILSTVSANQTSAVAEFRWRNGRWEMLFVRSDKTRANAANTVESTQSALQDHLSLTEFLIGVCSARCVVDQLTMERMDRQSLDQILCQK